MSTDLSGLEMGLRRPPLEFLPEAAVIVEETAADDPLLEALLTRESMEPEEPRALPARAQASSEARMTRMDPSAQGVWLEFEGARWFSSGPAVSYDPNRFVNVGSYRGFDVYRETTAPVDGDTIFVAVVSQGPLAPYSRR
jgi:hypothetical protein